MALKDWKVIEFEGEKSSKYRINNYLKVWKDKKSGEEISIYGLTSKKKVIYSTGRNLPSKNFKTKTQALKYARSYMRKH